jgi:hypothetical protein
MMVAIKSLRGAAPPSCGCESWLLHWERALKRRVGYCSVKDCLKVATVGAYIQTTGSTAWYVVPMCAAHHGAHEELSVVAAALVPAIPGPTCEEVSGRITPMRANADDTSSPPRRR